MSGGRGADGRKVRRILLVQLRYMGDVLLCTPALRAARRRYPGARIDFLTAAPGADALAGNPFADEILAWRPGLREAWALRRELRGRRYDLVVDFQSMPRTARLVHATRAPLRLGVRGRGLRNRLYTHLVSKEPDAVYVARQKLNVLAPLGIEPPPESELSLDLAIGPEERRRAREVWERHGLAADRPVVAVSPVSREPFKQWGAARWAEVADGIADAGARILVTSGPGEREQAEAVVRRMRHPAVWDYGPTTLRELGALYERCALWVGNDGGPKHVAAAAGTPTLTVIRWRIGSHWTDAMAAVPHAFIDAAPPQGCDLRCTKCLHRSCLDEISPDAVLAAAGALLRERATLREHSS